MSRAVRDFYARQEERERWVGSWRSALEPEVIPEGESWAPRPPVESSDLTAALNSVYLLMVRRKSVELLCESPIEADFAVAFLGITKHNGRAVNPVIVPFRDMRHFADTDVLLIPQWPIGRYRYDFLARSAHHARVVLIECDGKDFHSSREQTANDRRKDEEAKRAGIPLLRFKGTELFRDAHSCASTAWWQLEAPA